jgi:two-component system, OmpR family, sensor histidine kinase MtrB
MPRERAGVARASLLLMGDARKQPGLRTIATIALVILGAMAVIVSAALVVLTTKVQEATHLLHDSLASVRIAEDAALLLVSHERARSAEERVRIERELAGKLTAAGRYVTTPGESQALAEAQREVTRHFESERPPANRSQQIDTFGSAFAALEALVRVNEGLAGEAQRDALRWDTLGNVIGVAFAIGMVTVLAVLLWWLRRAAVVPAAAVANVMSRFARGELEVRAKEEGAAELRTIATRFNTMAATLARQEKSRLTYLAAVAHELRNPLNALQLSMAAIGPDAPLPPEARLRRVLEVTRRQIGRLDRMVGDLLEMARIEAGELTLKPAEVDLRVVAESVAALFEDASAHHEIRLDLPSRAVPVRCDFDRIEQAAANLVSNAIKYSPAGGIVTIAVRDEDDHVVLSVSDQGVGIGSDALEEIWLPFRRTAAAMESAPGVGLGLSVVRRIVTAHGGEVHVESQPGVGSTFTIELPNGARATRMGYGPHRGRLDPDHP